MKIDTRRAGSIDRPALRAYLERIRGYVSPGTQFDEQSFEAGFQVLDRDGDGRVTLEDLFAFTRAQQRGPEEAIPKSFTTYYNESKLS